MIVKIHGKNIEVTAGIAEKVEKKLNFLEKYFIIEEDAVAHVMVRVYRQGQKIEVTIPNRFGILRAEAVHDDLYAAIDLVIDKLEDQIRRQKTRLSRSKNKEKLSVAFVESQEDSVEEQLVKTKTITPSEMDLEEAILRMEMLGHDFFVYVDDETKDVAVVYRRNNGGYGLIETQR